MPEGPIGEGSTVRHSPWQVSLQAPCSVGNPTDFMDMLGAVPAGGPTLTGTGNGI